MKKHNLTFIIFLVAISLTGLIVTQILWLRKSVAVSEKQYDDRTDRMLEDVLGELEQFSDTSFLILNTPNESLIIFDVVDTSLLSDLLVKYITYHMLDTTYYYGLVRTNDNHIIYASKGFEPFMEGPAYKTCLSCIWKKEYIHLSVFFPNKNIRIYKHLILWVFLSFTFLLIITGAFVFIIYTVLRQKKISEIRNDFINNMTHEFKTPISTISLASEILLKDSDNPSSKSVAKYSKIIFEENQRMQAQVELVLQTALIEKEKIKLKREQIDVHNLLENTINSFCIESVNKKVQYKVNFTATDAKIFADPTHIRNVFSNIIDNAIKYSDDRPLIQISTENRNDVIQVSISDNGKGISRDTQKKIFDKFYRVPTGDVHDVKGFGLGLYYVKTIIEAHQGSVHVQSNLNKGTSFYVSLPRNGSIESKS